MLRKHGLTSDESKLAARVARADKGDDESNISQVTQLLNLILTDLSQFKDEQILEIVRRHGS